MILNSPKELFGHPKVQSTQLRRKSEHIVSGHGNCQLSEHKQQRSLFLPRTSHSL